MKIVLTEEDEKIWCPVCKEDLPTLSCGLSFYREGLSFWCPQCDTEIKFLEGVDEVGDGSAVNLRA